jgi:hypothetical protein
MISIMRKIRASNYNIVFPIANNNERNKAESIVTDYQS